MRHLDLAADLAATLAKALEGEPESATAERLLLAIKAAQRESYAIADRDEEAESALILRALQEDERAMP